MNAIRRSKKTIVDKNKTIHLDWHLWFNKHLKSMYAIFGIFGISMIFICAAFMVQNNARFDDLQERHNILSEKHYEAMEALIDTANAKSPATMALNNEIRHAVRTAGSPFHWSVPRSVSGSESGGRQFYADGTVVTSHPRLVKGKWYQARGAMQIYGPVGQHMWNGIDYNTMEGNVLVGVLKLSSFLDYYHGDMTKALMAYNGGHNAVKYNYSECKSYALMVLRVSKKFK